MTKINTAVVLIHGIGEQRPMNTLNGFVKSLKHYDNQEKIKHFAESWSSPDTLNNSFDLKRLSAHNEEKTQYTDFFEYYWAHQMNSNKFSHLTKWIKSLMIRDPRKVSFSIGLLWTIVWMISLFLLYLTIGSILSFFDINEVYLSAIFRMEWSVRILTAVSIIILSIRQIFVYTAGDAARYLKVAPTNVKSRDIIIKNGVNLLTKIHNSPKNYERVIIVGHSLGSVIGYDMLTYYWHLNYKEFQLSDKDTEFRKYIDQIEEYSTTINPTNDTLDSFRKTQLELNNYLRSICDIWRITDFVTLGSPLAHGRFLMANSKGDFEDRKSNRELPACPPKVDDKTKLTYPLNSVELTYFHHSVPFAITRWTNMTFGGDIIGGNVSDVFGKGIVHKTILYHGGWLKRFWSKCYPGSHTGYWQNQPEKGKESKSQNCVSALHTLISTFDEPKWPETKKE